MGYALKSDPTVGGIVAYGPADATTGLTGDASWSIRVKLGNVPADGTTVALWQCAGLHIEALYESSTTWRVRAKTFIASGGSITTTSSSPLDLDTEYVITVTHDVSEEDVTVYVDGSQVATGTAGTRIAGLAVWVIALPADSYAGDAAVWSSVIEIDSPYDPTTNPDLLAWWDASDTSTITSSSGRVDQINDKSGNANHLTAFATDTTRPQTGVDTVNGLNVLTFSGAQLLVRNDLLMASSSHTIVAVVKIPFSGRGAVISEGNTGNATPYYMPIHFNGTNTDVWWTWRGDAGSGTTMTVGSGKTLYDDTTHVVMAVFDEGSVPDEQYHTVDNSSGTANFTNKPAMTLNKTALGALIRTTNSNFITGLICEVLIYDNEQSGATRTEVYEYLAAKWGIT